jgi:uncharacterized small protein (DUF1192 family)/cell division protein FtsB
MANTSDPEDPGSNTVPYKSFDNVDHQTAEGSLDDVSSVGVTKPLVGSSGVQDGHADDDDDDDGVITPTTRNANVAAAVRNPVYWIALLLFLTLLGGFVFLLFKFFDHENQITTLQDQLNNCQGTSLAKSSSNNVEIATLSADNDAYKVLNAQLTTDLASSQTQIDTLTDENLVLTALLNDNELSSLVNQLEAQVAFLSSEIDRLSAELVNYGELNDALTLAVDALTSQNEILVAANEELNTNNLRYEELNQQLAASLAELTTQNQVLADQLATYAELNEDLSATANQLAADVDRLEAAVDNLGEQNENLRLEVDQLEASVQDLSDTNANLDSSIVELTTQVDRLANETDQLTTINNELDTIVSFLNETAGSLDQTYEAVTAFLSEQITAYRSIVLETLQNIYTQRLANWDCAYRDLFRLEDFVADENVAIDSANWPQVLAYVEERILSELCLSTVDFQTFLDNRYGDGISITTTRLIVSVHLYTMRAMNVYFPDEGEVGLTPADWASASYECANLATPFAIVS